MNKERRKAIADQREAVEKIKSELEDRLNEVQAEFRDKLEEVKSSIESLRDEEQEYFDNMPESFQNGEKGENAQTAIDALEEAASEIDNFDLDASTIVGGLFEDITSKLDDAEQA